MEASVTSPTDIVNSALNKMGAERILSLDDDSDRARLMKTQFPIKRNELLRAHPWRFSTAFVALARIEKPVDVFEYSYAYKLPSNCARVFKTNIPDSCAWEEIEGGLIVTNYSDSDGLKIKYGKIVTDVTKYDAQFVELLAWSLVVDTAWAITQSSQMVQTAETKFKDKIAEARSYSAQTGSVKQVVADDWLMSRY